MKPDPAISLFAMALIVLWGLVGAVLFVAAGGMS